MEPSSQSLSDVGKYLLAEGTSDRAYQKLGAHLTGRDRRQGVPFAVGAPDARLVSVGGDFNQSNPAASMIGFGRRLGELYTVTAQRRGL